jgi:hypothetical protein
MVSSLWSRDLHTLWHGIGRTLAPIVIKNKFKVVKNLLIIIFMSTLPFMLLPYIYQLLSSIYLYVYATIFSSIQLSSYIIFRHSILYYANY